MMNFSFENPAKAKAFRIGPNDTNYFAMLFERRKGRDRQRLRGGNIQAGGATPPNHARGRARILLRPARPRARRAAATM